MEIEKQRTMTEEARELARLIKIGKQMDTTGINTNQLYSLEQARLILQLQPRTVRNYINEGKLEASRVGFRFRILGQALLDFLDKRKVKPSKPK